MTDCSSYRWGHLLSFQILCNGNRIISKGNKSSQIKRTTPTKLESAGKGTQTVCVCITYSYTFMEQLCSLSSRAQITSFPTLNCVKGSNVITVRLKMYMWTQQRTHHLVIRIQKFRGPGVIKTVGFFQSRGPGWKQADWRAAAAVCNEFLTDWHLGMSAFNSVLCLIFSQKKEISVYIQLALLTEKKCIKSQEKVKLDTIIFHISHFWSVEKFQKENRFSVRMGGQKKKPILCFLQDSNAQGTHLIADIQQLLHKDETFKASPLSYLQTVSACGTWIGWVRAA